MPNNMIIWTEKMSLSTNFLKTLVHDEAGFWIQPPAETESGAYPIQLIKLSGSTSFKT